MTRLQALERVAEAARELFDTVTELANRDGGDYGPLIGPPAIALERAFARLDALPPAAPEPEGEVVEVRAVVFANAAGAWTLYGNHCDEDEQICDECKRLAWDDEVRIATIRARVPLPRVPEVAADVEGV